MTRTVVVLAMVGILWDGVGDRAAAQGLSRHWRVELAAGREAFGGASRDTATASPTDVEVAPAPRAAYELRVIRSFGTWEAGLAAGYAGGNLRAATPDVAVEDRSGGVTRYRLAALVQWRLAVLGPASLHLAGGPVLDRWETQGLGSRTVAGGRLGAILRFPLGRLTVENALSFALSASPFDAEALPPGATATSLRSWGLWFGLGYRL